MENSEDATGFGFLAGLIILIVTLLVLGYFYYKMEIIARSDEPVQLCRRTVDLSSIGHLSGVNLIDTLECPAVQVNINDAAEEKIKRKLADEMADCWYKFGGDSKELFDKNFGTERFCAVCSEIKFSGSAKNRDITGFVKYLSENNVKRAYGGKTYLEFLNTRSRESPPNEMGDTIRTSQDYAVIFAYDKTGKIEKALGTAIGASAGASAAIITGLLVMPEPVFTKALAGAIFAGVTLGGAHGFMVSAEGDSWASVTVLMPYTAETFDSLDCDKLPVRQDNK